MQNKGGPHFASQYRLSYNELIIRYDKLLRVLRKLPKAENHFIPEAMLLGANELIIRQDETGTDFTIAIITLLETASDEMASELDNEN